MVFPIFNRRLLGRAFGLSLFEPRIEQFPGVFIGRAEVFDR
jgi:hypothetical protein